MAQTLYRQKMVLMMWLMAGLWMAKANPARHPVRLDPFETLAQTLRQQKTLEAEAEPEEYEDYSEYEEEEDDYYQRGQLADGPSKARVMWMAPREQRGGLRRASDERLDGMYRYYRTPSAEEEVQKLLLDTFADYLWQYARKDDQQKRVDQGQKEVSVGSQQKAAMVNADQHLKNSSSKMATVTSSEDDLIRELNKLRTANISA